MRPRTGPLVIGGIRASRLIPAYVPDEPTALYRLIGQGGRLLYVGISRSPFDRMEQHVKKKPWWPEVDHSHVEWYSTRAEALDAEIYAIRTEMPAYNIQGIGGRSSTRRTPARPPVPSVAAESYRRVD